MGPMIGNPFVRLRGFSWKQGASKVGHKLYAETWHKPGFHFHVKSIFWEVAQKKSDRRQWMTVVCICRRECTQWIRARALIECGRSRVGQLVVLATFRYNFASSLAIVAFQCLFVGKWAPFLVAWRHLTFNPKCCHLSGQFKVIYNPQVERARCCLASGHLKVSPPSHLTLIRRVYMICKSLD